MQNSIKNFWNESFPITHLFYDTLIVSQIDFFIHDVR